jgi:hypothetical protein
MVNSKGYTHALLSLISLLPLLRHDEPNCQNAAGMSKKEEKKRPRTDKWRKQLESCSAPPA